MGRKYKCPICQKQIEEEQSVLIDKRHYCIGVCQQKKLEEKEDTRHYHELISSLCRQFNVGQPRGAWLKQIKDLHEKNGFKYQGILLTLNYFYGTLGNKIGDIDKVLGIVPYQYDKARDNYIQNMKRGQAVKEFFEKGQPLTTHKQVTIKPKTQKGKALIDMSIFEDIEEDTED